jgi:diaminohydroxyphosphoribosylaminopyrimidine deaminase/5-amino-6-(5-phosphoribosylamino)uracil reductase
VVAAMRDPNAVASGGMERLRTEGVDATISGESERARYINRRWLTWAQFQRPWVTLKAATSLDGRIATRTGQSKWITGSEARHRSLELREEHDAILVGVRTIVEDDPRLTRRLGLNPTDGWRRVILDSRLRTPTEAAVVRMEPDHTLIAHTTEAPREHRSRLADTGVQLVEFAPDTSGRVPLQALLEHLARLEIAALLVEGGAEVHGSFVDAGLVDETVFFVAPMLIGGPSLSAVAGRGIADLELAPRLVFDSISRRGNDLELCAVRREDDDVHGSD